MVSSEFEGFVCLFALSKKSFLNSLLRSFEFHVIIQISMEFTMISKGNIEY